MTANQVYKTNILDGFFSYGPIFFGDQLQVLRATVANRDDKSAGIGQLVQKGLRHLGAAGCNYYNIIRSIFRPAVGTVIQLGEDIEVMEFIKNGSGIYQQTIYPLNGVDLFTDKRKNGSLVA